MARAKRPVTIAGIEFDALISEEHGYEATVPEYAVESGFSVSDAIIHGAETLNMVLYGHIFSCVWKRLCGSERPTFVPFVWVPRFWREMPPLPDGVQLNY